MTEISDPPAGQRYFRAPAVPSQTVRGTFGGAGGIVYVRNHSIGARPQGGLNGSFGLEELAAWRRRCGDSVRAGRLCGRLARATRARTGGNGGCDRSGPARARQVSVHQSRVREAGTAGGGQVCTGRIEDHRRTCGNQGRADGVQSGSCAESCRRRASPTRSQGRGCAGSGGACAWP